MTGISEPSLAARPCYQVLLDHAADAVMVLDEHQRIIEWSGKAQTLFGWSAGEVLGKAVDDALLQSPLVPPADQDGSSADSAGMYIAAQALHKNGGIGAVTFLLQAPPVLSAPLPAACDGKEERLLMPPPLPSASLLYRLVDNLLDAVVVANSKGLILIANPAACLLFGWQHAGTPASHTVAEMALQEENGSEMAPAQHPLQLALSGMPVQQRIALVRSPHRALPVCVSINAAPLFDPDTQDL